MTMGNQWTIEQSRVIKERGRSLLVSAAAGSGKTAVLVERILRLVTDPVHPTEIDRILVVTFTRAAAGEMRERIRSALETAAAADPFNRYLARQAVLVHHARIMTIDSFCLDVIRSHFSEIGLDPAFRVADEGELLLLEQEVLENLLEDAYERDENGEFASFSENMASGRTDQGIAELISRFFRYSMGFPWPREWRHDCLGPYRVSNGEELAGSAWMHRQLSEVRENLLELRNMLEEALKLSRESDGPWMYETVLAEDMDILDGLLRCRNYEDYVRFFEHAPAFSRMPGKKDPAVSERKKEEAKALRDEVRDTVRNMGRELFSLPAGDLVLLLSHAAPTLSKLEEITDEFQERFETEKRERGIVDFHDLEHMALRILVRREDGVSHPTKTAEEYADQFDEIMIDEYQDSNLTQEVLLYSISGEAHGRTPNLFMVGDVKQSIYRFRLARPELFMEKFASYPKAEYPDTELQTAESPKAASSNVESPKAEFGKARDPEERVHDGGHLRIDLHRNFRSRPQVLRCVNEIFFRVMGKEIGRIDYDDDAALYPGADFEPVNEKPDPFLPELMLVEAPEEAKVQAAAASFSDPDDEDPEGAAGNRYAEARETAMRIRQLAGSFPVRDGQTGTLRPARYSDIVILLRSMSGWGEIYTEVLTSEGIPSFTETGSGYFTAPEIRTMMSFLSILDNPRQDIPLAGVLHSPLGGLDDEMLARIRIRQQEGTFYDACISAMEEDTPEGELLRIFFGRLDTFRKAAEYLQIHELIWKIMDETGYGSWVQALPAGEIRRANLEMLAEKAAAFEQGSYRGLFHFIRYIGKLRKYEIDYAQAQSGAGMTDAVRIMTIHKSKGLEFPIVIVSGLGKQFNRSSSSSAFVMHPELGAGFDFVDENLRIRCASPVRRTIAAALREEDLGEELRVLYVAMTRAKEKLILTGYVKDADQSLEKWKHTVPGENGRLPAYARKKSSCFLDLVMPALLDHISQAGDEAACRILVLRQEESEDPSAGDEAAAGAPAEEQTGMGGKIVRPDLRTRIEEALLEAEGRQNMCWDETLHRRLEKILETAEEHRDLREIPPKMSVSELKHQWMDLLDEESGIRTPDLPGAGAGDKYGQESGRHTADTVSAEVSGTTLSAAERGTLYHRVMELLDFGQVPEDGDCREFVQLQLESMVNCDKIQKDVCLQIHPEHIAHFLTTPLAKRMHRAALRNELHKETPFVLGVGADTLQEGWDPEETVLIQGIIDAWFEEDGGIILVDYKTDYVRDGDVKILTERYRAQMEYYRMALERLTQKKVTEMGLYSFRLGEFAQMQGGGGKTERKFGE